MQDRRLIGLIGTILLLLALAVLSAPHRSIQGPEIKPHQRAVEANQAQQGTQAKPSEATAATAHAPSVPAKGGDREGQTEAKQGRENSAEGEGGFLGTPFSAEAVIALFTVLLFAATFALYLATRDLVKGADKTAERQLRAYVGKLRTIIATWDAGGKVRVEVTFKNYGQTPALNFDTRLRTQIVGVPFTQDITAYQDDMIGVDMSLMPGAENITICECDIPDTATFQAQVGQRMAGVALFGSVVYEDIFAIKHVVHVNMIATGPRAFGRSPFIYLPTGNDET